MQRPVQEPRSARSYYLAFRMLEDDAEVGRRQRYTREISRRAMQRKLWNHMDLSDAEFKLRFRLTKEAFGFLVNIIREKTSLTATRRISLEMKLLCALSFYATGSYQRLVGMAKFLGQSSVSKYVAEVTEALTSPEVMREFIAFPATRQMRDELKNKFYIKYGIPGVVGCIDGCHFHIFKPKKEVEHLFYCRKHFHSINVQMICDSENKIININAKYGGATHDAFIWENSVGNRFKQQLHLNNEQVWLLGDSGYPQRPWLMTPITDAAEGSPEAKYTAVHGKARVAIENTFGRLKNRWRCLCKDRTLHYAPEKCAKIILACSVLHNIAIQFNVPEPDEVTQREQSFFHTETFHETRGGDDLVRGRALRGMLVSRINRLHP